MNSAVRVSSSESNTKAPRVNYNEVDKEVIESSVVVCKRLLMCSLFAFVLCDLKQKPPSPPSSTTTAVLGEIIKRKIRKHIVRRSFDFSKSVV